MIQDNMLLEKKIIFFTYLTNYNINEINRALSFNKTDDFIEYYLKLKKENSEVLSDSFVETVRDNSRQRFEEMRYLGINFISRYNKDYPESLKSISQSPPMIYVKGELKSTKNIAIVGTRDVSEFASGTIKKFVSNLVKSEHGVVSGLALGIDTLAHRIALENNIYTIAVLPNSLDHIYPKENYELANKILEQDGTLISELAIGINRGKKSFVERNRLQSGLSDFVFPVELGIKSGTMHTVDFTIRQDKFLLIKEVLNEQIGLSQYEGISYLKNKKYNKIIILNENMDNFKIKPAENISQPPTLF